MEQDTTNTTTPAAEIESKVIMELANDKGAKVRLEGKPGEYKLVLVTNEDTNELATITLTSAAQAKAQAGLFIAERDERVFSLGHAGTRFYEGDPNYAEKYTEFCKKNEPLNGLAEFPTERKTWEDYVLAKGYTIVSGSRRKAAAVVTVKSFDF